jgi:hypothetical protein
MEMLSSSAITTIATCRHSCSQKIALYPGNKEEDADDGNTEKGGDST